MSEMGDQILYSLDMQDRLDELTDLYVSTGDWDGEYADEYAALLMLKQEVRESSLAGAWADNMSFIRGDYFPEWCYDEQTDLYGKEVVDSGYWDEARWTEDRRAEFSEFEVAGYKYLADGR